MYEKHNLTTTFLLPLVGLNSKVLKAKANKSLRIVNAYIEDEEVDYYKDSHLFLVYKGYQSHLPRQLDSYDNFNVFEEAIISNRNFVDTYEFADGRYVVAVFNLEDVPEYQLFKEGKYSEFSVSAKNKCIDYGISTIWDTPTNLTKNTLMHIFRKSEERRKAFERHLGLEEGSMKGLELCARWSEEDDILTTATKQRLSKINNKFNFKTTI